MVTRRVSSATECVAIMNVVLSLFLFVLIEYVRFLRMFMARAYPEATSSLMFPHRFVLLYSTAKHGASAFTMIGGFSQCHSGYGTSSVWSSTRRMSFAFDMMNWLSKMYSML